MINHRGFQGYRKRATFGITRRVQNTVSKNKTLQKAAQFGYSMLRKIGHLDECIVAT